MARYPELRRTTVTVLALLFLIPIGNSSEAGGRDEEGTPGVRVTMEVPFASESLDAVKAATPSTKKRYIGNRAIPRKRIDRVFAAGPFDASAAISLQPLSISAPAVTPQAPVLDSSITGLGNPLPGQGDVIPPDTMGAAGPNHLVTLMNSEFGVFDKATGLIPSTVVSLESFWSFNPIDLPPWDNTFYPFDPKILYDQFDGRFVAVSIGGSSEGSSYILVAVSATSDPTGTWNRWAIPSSPDNTVWADFPGFGLDGSNLYVTANMFRFNPLKNEDEYQYSKAWVVPKAQLLSGTSRITRFEFPDPPGSGPTMQPAHTFDLSVPEYVVFEGGSGFLRVARFDNVAGTPVFGPPITVPVASFEAFTLLLDAPQAGDSRGISTSDTRLLNAVYRNGFLWTTHTVSGGGKTEVAWYRINPASGLVPAQGRIGDPSRWYYYPSIGVNRNGDAAIGFSGSSTQEYAGGYYTIVRAGSPTAEPVSLLKSGKAAYYKTLSGTQNRWGDFSATVVDPADDLSFWTLQEYAKLPVLNQNNQLVSQWGTWWGKFRPSNVKPPSTLIATASPAPQVVLNWTPDSVNQTGLELQRRRLPGEDYIPVVTLAPNVTTFTDNASTGLLGGFTYYYRVQAYNATGGSYSNEAFASTVAPPPPASGGGGGGCLAMAPSSGAGAEVSSILHAAILFLPAAVYRWRRRLRPGKS